MIRITTPLLLLLTTIPSLIAIPASPNETELSPITPTNDETAAPPTFPTTISSDQLELTSGESLNRFVFEGDVTIRGTELFASCNQMIVTTTRNPPSEGKTSSNDDPSATSGFGEFGAITSIVAIGNVRIQQGDREATAGRATILPIEGKVILEDSPVIRDPRGVLTGYRMILIEGERSVRIESGPDGDRTRAILPDIRDLQLDRPQVEQTPDSATTQP